MPRPALKTLTYSVMRFFVAITVAYAAHERVWERRGKGGAAAAQPTG